MSSDTNEHASGGSSNNGDRFQSVPDIEVEDPLQFFGGTIGALIPVVLTLGLFIWFSVTGKGTGRSFWVAGWVGVFSATLLAKDKRRLSESIIDGLGRREGIVIVAVWLFAGVFGTLLSEGGLVEGMLWFGVQSQLTGVLFIMVAYVTAMILSLGIGTSVGTVLALVPVMYPAGVALGANPWVLAVSLVAGGAFGDNLSPISDTTIASSMTQDAEIGDVVASRSPLAISAAIIGGVLLFISGMGGGAAADVGAIDATTNVLGLIQLVPLAIVIIVALMDRHLIEALSYGIISAIVIALAIGAYTVFDVVRIPEERGGSTGLIETGIDGVIVPIIFVLLILAILQILIDAGLMARLISWARQLIADTVRQAEVSIVAFTVIVSIPLGANVPAIIFSADYGKQLGRTFNLHPARIANLIDCAVCSLFYMLPWHGIVIVWYGILEATATQHGLPYPPITAAFTNWYSWALLLVILFSAYTGWTRSYADESISHVLSWRPS